ncbi:hypothetical protein SAMN02927930_00409 [Pseudidiomarina indica]|uniref:Uncharacterized protein n=1 Tax=Pseudidiomarina indica TaxID=1159017 RepID=A0A1G6AQS4_9GAMM|nr:hypothetical protein [Pseudidiomarina indica]SDB10725.1 hypothetical protein SAMN02927930_00409 [Pseudidiomarina indica]
MKSTIATRIGALAVIVTGILFAVLAPAGEAVSSYRQVGVVLLALGVFWLLRQHRTTATDDSQEPFERRPLKWYQAPVVWMPVIVILLIVVVQVIASA